MENELKNDVREEERVEEEVNIEELVKHLKEQGLGYDEILEALEKMLEEGRITEEDFEKAKVELEDTDKEEASKLFGVDII